MDLIPKPDQIVAAANNVAHKVFYGGLADLRPTPRTLIEDGPQREVYHYRPHKSVRTSGEPVLFVTPLAAPATCYDLRRDCSLVEHFVQQGRPTYLVEYGEISFADRNLGMEHWVDDVVPNAIKAVSEHAGRPVHVVGWSLGGIFASLVAADQPQLPIASLTIVGSPFDVTQVPLMAPLRPILRLTDGGVVTQIYRALGGAPKPLVRRAFQISSGTKMFTKPIATLQHLDDAEWLAQIQAVDKFTANMIAYPGRSFGQLYHRMLKHNQLVNGELDMGDRIIRIADIKQPVLVFAGNTDGIAPVRSVKAVLKLLTGASDVRFEIVPGGHLGMLTGRGARTTTWLILDEWFTQHSGTRAQRAAAKNDATTPDTKKAGAKRAATKKAGAKKASAKKASAKTATKKVGVKKAAATKPSATKAGAKRAATKAAPDRAGIGANRERRYGSASSRGLAPKS